MRAVGSKGGDDGLRVRRVTDADRAAVIELCRASLGWAAGDPNEAFFAWKHDHNPFGVSPAWVAETPDGQLAGLRVFLRWRFRRPDGTTFRAMRAVDTATHPESQGQGIFTRLTLGALDELVGERVACVFNTPNDQSRPGYLKMGWQVLGRVPVAVRVKSLRSVPVMRGARAAADKWSRPTDVGLDAAAVFADADATAALVARCGPAARIATDRDAAYLRWRYSFEPLHYRAVPLGDRLEDGVVVFRLRRRGTALEAAVCEILAPLSRSVRAVVGWVLRRSGADYAIRAGHSGVLGGGFVAAPRLGPVLTWRPVTGGGVPSLDQLDLALGDVELF